MEDGTPVDIILSPLASLEMNLGQCWRPISAGPQRGWEKFDGNKPGGGRIPLDQGLPRCSTVPGGGDRIGPRQCPPQP